MAVHYGWEIAGETFLVLEGVVHITVVDTREMFKYGPGDVGPWSRGTRTCGNVKSAFKKLCVVAEA